MKETLKQFLKPCHLDAWLYRFENKNVEEIIKNNVNGILFSNFHEIGSLLKGNINNKEKFERISNNAVKTIDKNFSLQSACDREFQYYNSIKLTKKFKSSLRITII